MARETTEKRMRQHIAIVLLGAILGAGGMMLAEGKAMDGLYLTHEKLTMQYEDLENELNHLRQELYLLTATQSRNVTNPTLKNIIITVENADPMTQLEVSKFIKANLDFLIGTQVRVFADAPTIITEVVDRKTLTINGQRVGLNLQTAVLLTDTLYVTVQTKVLK